MCWKISDAYGLLVECTANRYLPRTQSYIFHKYGLNHAWKEYNRHKCVVPIEQYFISCYFFSVNDHLQSEISHVKLLVYIQSVFGFSSKVKMYKHLSSPPNLWASTNPGKLFWQYYIFRDTLFIRDIYHHHHNFTWTLWTCPCSIYQVYSHLLTTSGAAYPPCLGLVHLGQYLGHILTILVIMYWY